MKLSSPRTWLVAVAGVLLLAGAGVVYLVKNPPLPPGWTKHKESDYSITAPIREHLPSHGGLHHSIKWFTLSSGGNLTIHSIRHTSRMDTEPLEAKLEYHLQREYRGRPGIVVLNCKQIISNGNPAYVLTTVEQNIPMKRLVVVTQYRLYEVWIVIAPGVFSEEDADIVFRYFRPK